MAVMTKRSIPLQYMKMAIAPSESCLLSLFSMLHTCLAQWNFDSCLQSDKDICLATNVSWLES